MTPDLLRMAGEALYGPRWQSALAHDLSVSDRQMRRWIAGDGPIPDGVTADLRAVVMRRAHAIRILLTKL